MMDFSKKDIVVNNLKIHSEAFGKPSNPACILIAGKMSTARFWSDAFCQYLAKQGFFTIRYDHRDVGESSEIDWQKEPYTMLDLANDAIAVMDGYNIKKAHFVGDSMGGWICQRIGIDYPERVLSLVIISAGPIEKTEEMTIPLTKKEQKTLDNTSKMFLSIKNGKTLEESVQNYLSAWRHLNAEIPLDEAMAKNFTRDFLIRTKNKNTQNHDLMMQKFLSQMKRENNLQKIKIPTLVIHGDKDPVVLPRHGKSVADAIPKSKLVMIKGMGHTFFNRALEEKIAKLVIEHFKKAIDVKKISFRKAKKSDLKLLKSWFNKPHVKEFWDNSPEMWKNIKNYLYGQKILYDYWIGFFKKNPFCLIITSDASENDSNAPGSGNNFLPYLEPQGKTWTIDFMIGEEAFLGKGLSYVALRRFTDFQDGVSAFLIDPASSNKKAIHVYEKAGFEKAVTFTPKNGCFAKIEHILMKKKLRKADFYD